MKTRLSLYLSILASAAFPLQATNLMHERQLPCMPPIPVLEEGALPAGEKVLAASFPNSRGECALVVEKGDAHQLAIVDATGRLFPLTPVSRNRFTLTSPREVMWIDDDTLFTGFSGRSWSEYRVVLLSIDESGGYGMQELFAGHLCGNEDYAANGDSLLLLRSEDPSRNGRLPLQPVTNLSMDVVGWAHGWILEADGQGQIDMRPALIATEFGIPIATGPFFRPGGDTPRIDRLPLPGFAHGKPPILSGGWAYIYPEGTPPTQKKQIAYQGNALPVLLCAPRANDQSILHTVVEYQGRPCLASLPLPSNAGVHYPGDFPELTTPPIPLEELPSGKLVSLISLNDQTLCLCSDQQWYIVDAPTGKRLRWGFRTEGSPEPIAVEGKLYEFSPATLTFTLLWENSKP